MRARASSCVWRLVERVLPGIGLSTRHHQRPHVARTVKPHASVRNAQDGIEGDLVEPHPPLQRANRLLHPVGALGCDRPRDEAVRGIGELQKHVCHPLRVGGVERSFLDALLDDPRQHRNEQGRCRDIYSLDWPGAWAFLVGMVTLSLVLGIRLARVDPGLLRERLAPPLQKDQAPADKVLLTVILLFILSSFAFMGLDAIRFGWSSVPPWVQAVGGLGVVLSVWMSCRTMRENSFAAPVVKIQKDRGQTVITTGPYRYVRHPFYAGALVFFAGTSLLLGSWWGLVAVLLIAVLLGIRIGIEEKALRAGLDGYDDYAERVRYRLIPLVW